MSVSDLYARTLVDQRQLESLIKGGFLDVLAPEGGRNALLGSASRLPKKSGRARRGQKELPLPHPASWWERREKIAERGTEYLPLTGDLRERQEWDALALNVSRHPLSPYRRVLRELGVVPSREILDLPHGTRVRAAGLLETLQRPPTKSGRPVYFLLIEDEWGLLQATIFRPVYERFGAVLHHEGAFLLDGKVEQTIDKGFSFLVHRLGSLQEILAETKIPSPQAVPSSGAFLRAGRRTSRTG